MLNKRILQIMAESERLMDEGKIPFVIAPGPNGIMERLAMSNGLMEDFGLKQGQTINSIIRDAILEHNAKSLMDLLRNLEEREQLVRDEGLDSNFDFRNLMGDGNDTKH